MFVLFTLAWSPRLCCALTRTAWSAPSLSRRDACREEKKRARETERDIEREREREKRREEKRREQKSIDERERERERTKGKREGKSEIQTWPKPLNFARTLVTRKRAGHKLLNRHTHFYNLAVCCHVGVRIGTSKVGAVAVEL